MLPHTRALLFTSTALLWLFLSSTASAHHVVSDTGIAWVEPISVGQLELSTSRFDLGSSYQQGRWWSVATSVELALHKRFSLMVRAPVVRVNFDDGRAAMGLGDMDVSAKFMVFADKHGKFILSAGAAVELPTGSAEDALGAGHVELSPFVAASSNPLKFIVINALFSERISLEGDEELQASHQGSPLSMHAPHELMSRLTVSYVPVAKRYYTSAGVDYILTWSSDYQNLATGRLEAGLYKERSWRVALRLEQPLGGDRYRSDTTLSSNLALWF